MNSSKTGSVYVINKFKVKNNYPFFRCIMIYKDEDSGFFFIKPLLNKIDLEIVMELFKIFTSYGPPNIVIVNSCNSEMVTGIATNMKMLSPFDIHFVKPEIMDNEVVMTVVNKIHNWMDNTQSRQWEIGCSIVQREMNSQINTMTGHSPYELFFNGCAESDSDEFELDDELFDNEVAIKSEDLDYITVEVKEEKIDIQEMDVLSETLKNSMNVFEDGILFDKCKVNDIQIKEEIIDENFVI